MPLINQGARDDKFAGFSAYDHQVEAPFNDVFAASLGQVFDEELSISSMLNREGFTQRKATVDNMIANGEIENAERYRTKGGRNRTLDYNKIAQDLGREDVKTDAVLNEERNATLKARREYAQETLSRGSGTAQFLGAMNGYLLDPINAVTLGLAVPSITAKGVGTIGRIALATRDAAIIEGATELGIQAFVFEHKQDIDSPYSAGDALASIGLAAVGGGVIGGVTRGVGDWLGRVINQADSLPPARQTPELQTAKQYLRRQQNTLRGSPKVADPIDIEAARTRAANDVVTSRQSDLAPLVERKLEASDLNQMEVNRNALIKELRTLQPVDVQDSFAAAKFEARQNELLDEIDSIDTILAEHKAALRAQEEIRAIQKGEYSPELQASIARAQDNVIEAPAPVRADVDESGQQVRDPTPVREGSTSVSESVDNPQSSPQGLKTEVEPQTINEQQVAKDLEYLGEMNRRATQYAPPSKTAAMYEKPAPSKKPNASASTREREILEAQGLDDAFNQEMAKFNSMENKLLIVDGEVVDADDLVKSIDDEIAGLDSVLTCAYGRG